MKTFGKRAKTYPLRLRLYCKDWTYIQPNEVFSFIGDKCVGAEVAKVMNAVGVLFHGEDPPPGRIKTSAYRDGTTAMLAPFGESYGFEDWAEDVANVFGGLEVVTYEKEKNKHER